MLRPTDAGTLASVFGLDGDARLDGPVERGEQGQVWRLEVGGQRYAVKEALVPLADEQAQLAHAFSGRAQAAGVRAPEAILTRDGEVLARTGSDPVRLYRWVELAGLDRGLDPDALGRCLAALHRTGAPLESRVHPWYWQPVGRARWAELTGDLGRRGAPFADRLAGLVDELVAVEAVFVEPTARILCHRDLFADNVRATPDGGLAVIDWDNCGAASADQELGMVLMEFGGDEERILRLDASYRSAGGPGRITSVRDLTMAAATVGHIGELTCRQWLEAPGEAGRRRAEGRADEFLGEPWTLDVLERLVGLVA
jgi:Ser/Thr protein kinase RdoA (MazF antagonist)